MDFQTFKYNMTHKLNFLYNYIVYFSMSWTEMQLHSVID